MSTLCPADLTYELITSTNNYGRAYQNLCKVIFYSVTLCRTLETKRRPIFLPPSRPQEDIF
jgi:hypothetical protein